MYTVLDRGMFSGPRPSQQQHGSHGASPARLLPAYARPAPSSNSSTVSSAAAGAGAAAASLDEAALERLIEQRVQERVVAAMAKHSIDAEATK